MWAGVNGQAGLNGTPGSNGAPGANGSPGASGAAGALGAPGAGGSRGANGANGRNGMFRACNYGASSVLIRPRASDKTSPCLLAGRHCVYTHTCLTRTGLQAACGVMGTACAESPSAVTYISSKGLPRSRAQRRVHTALWLCSGGSICLNPRCPVSLAAPVRSWVY